MIVNTSSTPTSPPSSDSSTCMAFTKVMHMRYRAPDKPWLIRHTVSDVFHTGSPESTLWEFKHGNGNFKRGDLAGLREIKRRASRHALIHRDSFSTPHKPSVSQPGTPAEPVLDVGEARLQSLEHSLYEIHSRLVRTEENNTALSAKCQALNDSIVRCHQVSNF